MHEAPVPATAAIEPPERPLRRRVGWSLFAAATLALAAGLPRQPVDPSNRALKDPGSADAANLQALAAVVPDRPTVLLGFATRAARPLPEQDRGQLAALRTRLTTLPGVHAVDAVPLPVPDLSLWTVALDGADPLAAANAVGALARSGAPPTVQVLATGLPLVEGRIAERVAGERPAIVPLLVGVLFVLALLGYRSAALAAGTLLPPLAGIAWTGGLLAWLGHPLDPVAALLDPVLLTIGVAGSVHVVEAFRRQRAAGVSVRAAARAAARDLRTPAALAAATTMIGLWSLTGSAVPAVVDFGVRAAFGVGLTHAFTLWLLPAWLGATGARAPAARAADALGGRWLAALRRRRTPLLAGTAALGALAAAGLGRLSADNDPLHLLPPDEPVRMAHEQLAARLGGVERVHLLVPARSRSSDPSRLLAQLAAAQATDGIAGLAGPVQRGAAGELAAPLLLAPGGSAARVPLFAELDAMLAVLGSEDIAVAGAPVQIARDSHRLIRGLVDGLGCSLLLLTAVMAAGLRSLRLGLLAMLPNLLPSLWLYGGLAWAGRPVSVATAMIGTTMLGLVVDNTLHLLHHYRNERRLHPGRQALRAALDHAGRATTLASLVLVAGFTTAAASRLPTTVEFACLAAATIVAAWFATAVVLPLLLLRPEGCRA